MTTEWFRTLNCNDGNYHTWNFLKHQSGSIGITCDGEEVGSGTFKSDCQTGPLTITFGTVTNADMSDNWCRIKGTFSDAIVSSWGELSWSPISESQGCRENDEGISRSEGRAFMNFETCKALCLETSGCKAIDYLQETGWCDLFDDVCSTPRFSSDGVSSWKLVDSDYVQIHAAADCCRNNNAQIEGTANDVASTPSDCEARCTELETCNYFSHSSAFKNCSFCSACDLTTTGNSAVYTSWEKQQK